MTLLDIPTLADMDGHSFIDIDLADIYVAGVDTVDEVSIDAIVAAPNDEHDDQNDDQNDDDAPTLSSFARCADGNGTLTHLFFSDDEFDTARAKAICSKCGLADSCLSDALDRAEPYGVWGGQLVIDGAVVAVKRGRGRPPKVPRAALVVDEVPIPPHLVA